MSIEIWAAFVLAAIAQSEKLPQFLILGATFLSLAALNSALYALFAGQLRDRVQNQKVQRWLNRCGASVLIGAGVATATLQRSS